VGLEDPADLIRDLDQALRQETVARGTVRPVNDRVWVEAYVPGR
jgi:hypothetical protein